MDVSEEGVAFDDLKQYESEYNTTLMMPPSEEDDLNDLKELINNGQNIWENFRKTEFYHTAESIDNYSSTTLKFLLIPFYQGKLLQLYNGDDRSIYLVKAYKYLKAYVEEMIRHGIVKGKKQPVEEKAKELHKIEEVTMGKRMQLTPISSEVDFEKTLTIDLLKVSVIEARSMLRNIDTELSHSSLEYTDLHNNNDSIRLSIYSPL